jgi:hypothetical protein
MKAKILLIVLTLCGVASSFGQKIDNLTYLNGYNFDFNSTDKTSGYLGNLNLFFMLKNNKKPTQWCINAGLKKINYAFSDNSVSEEAVDNIKLKPLQNVAAIGDKYLTEYNRYTTITKINSWSAYFQLMHKITKIQNLYAHLHTELQISKVNFKTSIQTLDTITTTVTNTSAIPALYNTLDKEYSLDKTYFGYYFGAGITGDFIILDKEPLKLRYFVQGTVGFSNIKSGSAKSLNGLQTVKDNYSDFMPNFETNNHTFHLFNTYVSNKINGLEIQIGSEIRGNFTSPPLYIFYVGLNTDLENIAKLFSSTSQKSNQE